jgi:hypothetical protein
MRTLQFASLQPGGLFADEEDYPSREKGLIQRGQHTDFAEDAEVAQPGRAPDLANKGEAEDRVDHAI